MIWEIHPRIMGKSLFNFIQNLPIIYASKLLRQGVNNGQGNIYLAHCIIVMMIYAMGIFSVAIPHVNSKQKTPKGYSGMVLVGSSCG